MAVKVLVVDDEKLIIKGIAFSLTQDGMEVDVAYDGEDALVKASENPYDIILLDVMLPKVDGMEVCRRIRETSNVPIIMLTAKGDDMDKILGLEYGADDYITKPFNILEVKARIKTIIRRSKPTDKKPSSQNGIVSGDIRLDLENRRFSIKDREINLTSREFDMMLLFVQNPNRIFTREELLRKIWGEEYPEDARTVDVHIRRLREKIEPKPSDPLYVCTRWGSGYYYRK